MSPSSPNKKQSGSKDIAPEEQDGAPDASKSSSETPSPSESKHSMTLFPPYESYDAEDEGWTQISPSREKAEGWLAKWFERFLGEEESKSTEGNEDVRSVGGDGEGKKM